MERKEIITEIINYIEDNVKSKVYNKCTSTGYFVFDVCDDFNTSFKIKGCKGWKFGIWIHDNEEGYEVEVFGQYIKFIDKFKPSASVISYAFKVDEGFAILGQSYPDVPLPLYEFVFDIKGIKRSRIGSLIKFYWNTVYGGGYNEGAFAWLISNLWFYRVSLPIREFYENELTWFMLYIKTCILKLAISKWTDQVILIDRNTNGWKTYPRYVLKIRYKNVSAKSIAIIYHLVSPLHVCSNYRISHLTFDNDRFFYYQTDAIYSQEYEQIKDDFRFAKCKFLAFFTYLYKRIKLSFKWHYDWKSEI